MTILYLYLLQIKSFTNHHVNRNEFHASYDHIFSRHRFELILLNNSVSGLYKDYLAA